MERSFAYAVCAEFELHVHIPVVLEAVLKRDNVGVNHGLVNLDLGKQLQNRKWGFCSARSGLGWRLRGAGVCLLCSCF